MHMIYGLASMLSCTIGTHAPGSPDYLFELRAILVAAACAFVFLAFMALVRGSTWRLRMPLPPALLVVVTWATFLCAPGTAHASALSGSSSGGGLLGFLFAALAFGIAVATPPIAPTPGAATSEFSLAKYVTYFGMALTTVGTLLATVSAILPSGSKAAMYVGVALAVIGALTKVATALGYSSDRSDQKVAAIQGQAAVAAAQVQAAASKSPEAAAEALK